MADQEKPELLLGKHTPVTAQYTPALLYPIVRSEGRKRLRLTDPMPFEGFDLWHAYEMSWLDERGKPVARVGRFSYPRQFTPYHRVQVIQVVPQFAEPYSISQRGCSEVHHTARCQPGGGCRGQPGALCRGRPGSCRHRLSGQVPGCTPCDHSGDRTKPGDARNCARQILLKRSCTAIYCVPCARSQGSRTGPRCGYTTAGRPWITARYCNTSLPIVSIRSFTSSAWNACLATFTVAAHRGSCIYRPFTLAEGGWIRIHCVAPRPAPGRCRDSTGSSGAVCQPGKFSAAGDWQPAILVV